MSAAGAQASEAEDVGGVAVVDFVDSGLMFEAALIQDLGEELQSLLTDHGYTRILLDFAHVQYLSSTMLGQLAKLAKEVERSRVSSSSPAWGRSCVTRSGSATSSRSSRSTTSAAGPEGVPPT